MYFSIRGDGSFFFGAMLVINMSAKCSMSIVALGKCSRKGVTGQGFHIIVMR